MQTRIFFTMAQDGLLPSVFAQLHHRYRTPAVSQILVGVVVALAAGLFPIDILGEMVSIVSASATELRATAESMSGTAGETNQQASVMAAAAERRLCADWAGPRLPADPGA